MEYKAVFVEILVIVRISQGSLAVLGLAELKMDAEPTTLYLLQHSPYGCTADCAFCTQSRRSKTNKAFLSRVVWPRAELEDILGRIRATERVKRICLQTVIKEGFAEEAIGISRKLASTGIPVSVTLTPVDRETLLKLHQAGVERLGVGLDAATPEAFRRVGKPYTWGRYMEFIGDCVDVFGRRRVHVHLVYGLGEGEGEFLNTMVRLYGIGAEVALFSFTPVSGTPLSRHPQPDLGGYRVMQVLRLLLSRDCDVSGMVEAKGGRIYIRRSPVWLDALREAVLTSGCPWCNRPFYNESPRSIRNYPSLGLVERDLEKILREISGRVVD